MARVSCSLSVNTPAKTLEAIRYQNGSLSLLDQLRLPHETLFLDIPSCEAGWTAIRTMQVRGAPAIAIAAMLSLAVEIRSGKCPTATPSETVKWVSERLDFLGTSRPTAVNLFEAIGRFKSLLSRRLENRDSGADIAKAIVSEAEAMLERDIQDNKAIGENGAQAIRSLRGEANLKVLTHCNTGSLATAGWGTALGIIRSLHAQKALRHAWCTETRPYNQGARLTAYELVYEGIPATLITDSMAPFLMATQGLDAVVVGADRVTANGDTANKIGTYMLALAASYHKIPFFVAAPFTSIDLGKATGAEIHIEERPPHELTHVNGHHIAAPGIGVWNPSFDVTPSALISGIVTEKGVAWRKEGATHIDLPAFVAEIKSR